MRHPKDDLSSYSDDELLDLLAQNDKAALSTLFDRYSTDLYIYIKEILRDRVPAGQVREATHNILIEVFISLSYDPPPTSPPVTVADHLFTTANRMAIDHARRSNSQPEQ
jgi:DNA-directed RNA polymerase specialized sigma24 family protein